MNEGEDDIAGAILDDRRIVAGDAVIFDRIGPGADENEVEGHRSSSRFVAHFLQGALVRHASAAELRRQPKRQPIRDTCTIGGEQITLALE
jgi:hypothetical protein